MSISAVGSVPSQIQPQQASTAALKGGDGDGDGDGRTGVSALNDGDGGAQLAATQVSSSRHTVDVRA